MGNLWLSGYIDQLVGFKKSFFTLKAKTDKTIQVEICTNDEVSNFLDMDDRINIVTAIYYSSCNTTAKVNFILFQFIIHEFPIMMK